MAWVVREVRRDIQASLPAVDEVTQPLEQKISRVYSDDGKLIATLFKQNQKPIASEAMGQTVRDAIVSIEDSRFHGHTGVDYKGVARAAVANFSSGGIEQGASTITMQLARKLYLTNEQSLERKIKEMLLAQKIEKYTNKDVILTRYLNECYFGAGAYGVAAAANRYYHKTPKQLTVAEAALLAGLVQAPSTLSPLVDATAAKHRQMLVLTRMRDLEKITPAQFLKAKREAIAKDFSALAVDDSQPMLKYPYFTTYALRHLPAGIKEEDLYNGSLAITTTLDIKAQRHAEKVVRQMVAQYGPQAHVDACAAVLIENSTGEVKAMVGGKEWTEKDQFNRAWQARRQPGSTFKPFLYASALENGWTEETIVQDSPVSLVINSGPGQPAKLWEPHNADGKGLGAIPLREALRMSRNQAAANIFSQVGIDHLLDTARRFGIESELPRVPSLALGSAAVTPVEMASAYSVLANGGERHESKSIKSIVNLDGTTLVAESTPWARQVVSEGVAAEMTDMMMRVVRSGTATNAQMPGITVAGKTGTTDSYKDAWFIGFTPKYTLAVWMGNDNNKPTYGVYGGSLPALTWKQIMKGLDQGPRKSFAFLNDKPHSVRLCKESHHLATGACVNTYRETFYIPTTQITDCSPCRVAYQKKMLRQQAKLRREATLRQTVPDVQFEELEPYNQNTNMFDAGSSYPKAQTI